MRSLCLCGLLEERCEGGEREMEWVDHCPREIRHCVTFSINELIGTHRERDENTSIKPSSCETS